jgi:hypothetical protein
MTDGINIRSANADDGHLLAIGNFHVEVSRRDVLWRNGFYGFQDDCVLIV